MDHIQHPIDSYSGHVKVMIQVLRNVRATFRTNGKVNRSNAATNSNPSQSSKAKSRFFIIHASIDEEVVEQGAVGSGTSRYASPITSTEHHRYQDGEKQVETWCLCKDRASRNESGVAGESLMRWERVDSLSYLKARVTVEIAVRTLSVRPCGERQDRWPISP